jgi:hypothetical protein
MITYPTIPLSGTVTDVIDVSQARDNLGLWIPTITSGQVLLRGSFDQTSANFVPVFNPNATPISSRWYVDAAAGNLTLAIDWQAVTFPFIKLETSVVQAAVRSFAVFSKGAGA